MDTQINMTDDEIKEYNKLKSSKAYNFDDAYMLYGMLKQEHKGYEPTQGYYDDDYIISSGLNQKLNTISEVCIYCRVSSVGQRHNSSYWRQLDECIKFCVHYNLRDVITTFDCCTGGYVYERPGLHKIAIRQEFDGYPERFIIFESWDRYSRTSDDRLKKWMNELNLHRLPVMQYRNGFNGVAKYIDTLLGLTQ